MLMNTKQIILRNLYNILIKLYRVNMSDRKLKMFLHLIKKVSKK